MEPTEQLTVLLPTLEELVDRIDPADLDHTTPCANFTLHDVLVHVIMGGSSFAYQFRGEQPPELSAPIGDGRVPAAEFRKAMGDLLDAVRSEGALARTIASPFGEMPGETIARLVAFDGLVHGWDIARATGLSYDLPADLVEAVDTFARAALADELRDGDTFKEQTTPPPDATAIDRLAAFSGRTV
jgi:uncharacterized protein (TIGR03086 family)